MSDMKCPFCQQELKQDYYDCEMLECHNPKCKHYYDGCIGREELWQELIRTRKALDVAVDAFKNATEYLSNQEPLVDVMAMNLYIDLSKALDKITALTKGDDNE